MKRNLKLVLAYTADISAILIAGQVRYFVDKGYEVHIITNVGSRTLALVEREGGIPHTVNFEREISLFKDLKALIKTTQLIRHINPDIVNAGTPKASLLVLLASRFLRVPKRVYTCRGFRFETEVGFKRKILKGLEKLSGMFAHKIICISPSLRDLAVSERLFDVSKTVVIGKGSSNGIDLDRFSASKLDLHKLNNIANRYHIGKEYFTIGFAGRLHSDKGIKELLAAYDLLKNKHKNLKMMLVGSIESDVFIKELQRRIKDKDLVHVGFQKSIEYFIAQFDVLVLPSYREGFGNVLIQAAALGVPTITNDVTGCKDAVKNNFNGFIVQPKNVDALVKKIDLLIENQKLREEMARNGVKFSKWFDSSNIWKGLEELYLD